MNKWSEVIGVTHVIFTFPENEKVIIDKPLWEQVCTKTGKRYFLTSDGRDFTVNGGWLVVEYAGPNVLTPQGKPNVTLLRDEE